MEQNLQSRSLVKATIISVVIAIFALILFILPAEYNIDPTGVGTVLGLTVFNEQPKATAVIKAEDDQGAVLITIPAGRGIEYKLAMKQFEKVSYQWHTNTGQVYVDLHGEPKGDTSGYFESYTIAVVDTMKGSFTAPFEGSHGWYWKNKTDKAIDVQLTFSGQYIIEGVK
jgi:hypothetical protein